MVEHNVFRDQVLAFGETSMGHRGLGMLTFLPRAHMWDDELVLPDHVLASIERHVLGIAEARARLRLSGQHVKRGLMLHGPPGTGKTHTIRYLISTARDHTVIVLTGGALGWIRAAVGLARLLQPCIVVCEDVDLVAQERGPMPGYSNPVLFDMLNAIDGIEEDADVTFILTTNRADLLEPALAARPGRVDLAMEIPLPDAEARRRLIDLYGRGLDVRLADPDTVVERTAGVTASFIRELLRKAAMIAAADQPGDGRIALTDAHVTQALDELLDEESTLTRALLGGRRDAEASRPGVEWLRTER
jgi:ATP-dependent 26S proteasome regulatory subunit